MSGTTDFFTPTTETDTGGNANFPLIFSMGLTVAQEILLAIICPLLVM